MNLSKTTFLSLILTGARTLSGFIISKLIAIQFGPIGLALVGQLQNTIQVAMLFSQAFITNGVVSIVSQTRNKFHRVKVVSSAIFLTISASVFVGLLLLIFSDYVSIFLFSSQENSYLLRIFSFTILFYSLNNLFLSVINGLQNLKLLYRISIIQTFASFLITLILIFIGKLQGALLSLVLSQTLVFFLIFFATKNKFSFWYNCLKKSKKDLKVFIPFMLMGVVSSFSQPIVQLLIRKLVVVQDSFNTAGKWQAMNYISTTLVTVLISSLSIYYIPKFSQLTDKESIKKEVLVGYKYILPILFISFILIVSLKAHIIPFLFSKQFNDIGDLFFYQTLGDCFKILSYIPAYVMISKLMVKTFLVSELLFGLSQLMLSYFFLHEYGFVGLSYAHAFNYFLYLSFISFYFWKYFKN